MDIYFMEYQAEYRQYFVNYDFATYNIIFFRINFILFASIKTL